jgi:hypothetical protein
MRVGHCRTLNVGVSMLGRMLMGALWVPVVAVAAPRTMTHSGRVLTAAGDPVDTTASVAFALRDSTNVDRWTETHTVTFEDGYYAVVLGTTTPLDPAVLYQDLKLVVTMGSDTLVNDSIASTPYALSVEGHVQVATATSVCGTPEAGTLRWISSRLEVCDGTAWGQLRTTPSTLSFRLPFDFNVNDSLGQVSFVATSQIQYTTPVAQGTRAVAADIYGSGLTSPYDYAVSTTTAHPQWSLHPSVSGNFTLEFDHRHTADAGWESIIASNTTSWNTGINTWCTNTSPGTQANLPDGWAFMVNWSGHFFCFNTSLGAVKWVGLNYHTNFRHIKLTRTGTTLELFYDGVSQGTRTMPGIASAAASQLYLIGSSNGLQTSYNPGSYSLNAQVDDLQFVFTP